MVQNARRAARVDELRELDAPDPETGELGRDSSAAEALIQLSRQVQSIHGQVAADHGLTQVQATMVCILAFGSRGMADLARCLGVEKATLTGLVDRAERRGLVTRGQVPGDRRALAVSLTASGRATAAAFHADAVKRLDEFLAPLSPAQRDQFRGALATILSSPDHQRSPAEPPSLSPDKTRPAHKQARAQTSPRTSEPQRTEPAEKEG